jgi:hypothetical protein
LETLGLQQDVELMIVSRRQRELLLIVTRGYAVDISEDEEGSSRRHQMPYRHNDIASDQVAKQ